MIARPFRIGTLTKKHRKFHPQWNRSKIFSQATGLKIGEAEEAEKSLPAFCWANSAN